MGLFKAYIRVRTRRCVGRVSLGTTLSLRICQPRPPPTRSFPTSNVSDESSTTHLRRKPVLGVLVDAFSSGAGHSILRVPRGSGLSRVCRFLVICSRNVRNKARKSHLVQMTRGHCCTDDGIILEHICGQFLYDK